MRRLLCTYRIMVDPIRWYKKWRERYGSTYLVPAINGDVVVTSTPENVRRLFKLRSDETKPFAMDAVIPVIGRGSIFLLSGVRHRKERRILMPPFHGERMRSYGDAIRQIAERAAAKWEVGQPVDIAEDALDLSLEVILRAVFGVTTDERVAEYKVLIEDLVGRFHPILAFAPFLRMRFFGWSPWDRFLASRERFDAVMYEDIAARRASGERGVDILSLLLDATYEDGSQLSDELLRDELISLLIAGHETTQIMLTWALYRLQRHDDIREALVRELHTSRGAESDAIVRLPVLNGVLSETLRLHPVLIDSPKELTTTVELEEVTLEPGDNYLICMTSLHRNPDIYEDPDVFDPERWVDRTYKPFEYCPFGGGVRRCIGSELALYEMKTVLAIWVGEHRFSNVDDPKEDLGTTRRNITVGPKRELRLVYEGRR
jgi:cytochrome P450